MAERSTLTHRWREHAALLVQLHVCHALGGLCVALVQENSGANLSRVDCRELAPVQRLLTGECRDFQVNAFSSTGMIIELVFPVTCVPDPCFHAKSLALSCPFEIQSKIFPLLRHPFKLERHFENRRGCAGRARGDVLELEKAFVAVLQGSNAPQTD